MEKVNSPEHYKTETGKEVWELMIERYGLTAFLSFCELNAFKYRMRAGKKPGNSAETDLQKAQWYEQKIKSLKSL